MITLLVGLTVGFVAGFVVSFLFFRKNPATAAKANTVVTAVAGK
jgi:hypothetical protein